jgi:hypothetical protein
LPDALKIPLSPHRQAPISRAKARTRKADQPDQHGIKIIIGKLVTELPRTGAAVGLVSRRHIGKNSTATSHGFHVIAPAIILPNTLFQGV